MAWNKFSIIKLVLATTALIIGVVLKFPIVLESYPAKYKILSLTLSQAQYSTVNIVAIAILILSTFYILILLWDRSRSMSKQETAEKKTK